MKGVVALVAGLLLIVLGHDVIVWLGVVLAALGIWSLL